MPRSTERKPERRFPWPGAGPLRPQSLYFFLSIPVVMLLALGLLGSPGDPSRFALTLSLLFVFLGIVLVRAVMDLMELGLQRVRADRDAYRETLGDADFAARLGRGVRAARHD